jgi:hypothetical protein
MVKHGDEPAGALGSSQVAGHLHSLHQHLSQLLAQLQDHWQGPGPLWRSFRCPQCLPVLPRQVGYSHLWKGVIRESEGRGCWAGHPHWPQPYQLVGQLLSPFFKCRN